MYFSEYRDYLIKAAAVVAVLSLLLEFVLGTTIPQDAMLWIIYVIGLVSISIYSAIRDYTHGASEWLGECPWWAKALAGFSAPLLTGYILTAFGSHETINELIKGGWQDPAALFIKGVGNWIWIMATFILPPSIYFALAPMLKVVWQLVCWTIKQPVEETRPEKRNQKQVRPTPQVKPDRQAITSRANQNVQQERTSLVDQRPRTPARLVRAKRADDEPTIRPIEETRQELIPPDESHRYLAQVGAVLQPETRQELMPYDESPAPQSEQQPVASVISKEQEQPETERQPKQEPAQKLITSDGPTVHHVRQGARINRAFGIWQDKSLPPSEQVTTPFMPSDQLMRLAEETLRLIDETVG